MPKTDKRYDNVKGVRLDDATLTQVQQVARQNNQTFSEYVRELIKKALTEV